MTTFSLSQSGGNRRRALLLLAAAALLLAGLGTRTWWHSDDATPAVASGRPAATPLYVLPAQPADSVTTLVASPARPAEAWERNLREARHPEP